MKKMEYQSPSMHDSVAWVIYSSSRRNGPNYNHVLLPPRSPYSNTMWRDGKYRYYLAIEDTIFEAIVGTSCPYGLPVIAIPKNSRVPLIPVTVSGDKGMRIWLDMTCDYQGWDMIGITGE